MIEAAMTNSTTTASASTEFARKSDPRSLRSQERLRGGLLKLVETTSFEKITLRDITSAAGVSYPTFFKHYADKQDLFLEIARNASLELLTKGFRNDVTSPDWRPGEGICSYITSRRALWRTLLTAGASEAMRSELIRCGREFPRSRTNFGHGFPIDVVSGVIASGTFEIISWWLAHEADHSTGQIADMLETLIIEPALNLPPGYFTSRKGMANVPIR